MELNINGLKCDNPSCDWRDDSIQFEDYKNHINRACPKCGENVLTFDDFMLAMSMVQAVGLMNELSPEQIKELEKAYNVDKLKSHPAFKDTEDLDILTGDPDQLVNVSFNAHKNISVAKITAANPNPSTQNSK